MEHISNTSTDEPFNKSLINGSSTPSSPAVRFDSTQAFYILFAVSFGPTFIALNLSIDQNQNPWADFLLIMIITFVFFQNYISVDMLTKVHSKTQMTSYQEIAYKISNWNRGYIYLLSLLKALYLIVTCAYCLQFCSVYPVSVVQVWWQTSQSEYIIWLVMMVFMLLLCALILIFYTKSTRIDHMLLPAKLLFFIFLLNVSVFIVLLIPFYNKGYKNWMYQQICHSGDDLFADVNTTQWEQDWLTPGNSCNTTDHKPSQNMMDTNLDTMDDSAKTSFMSTISYAPLLAYCNMFSIYYLEVISNTKLLTKKNEADSLMGKLVNYIVCGFYVFLFALVTIVQWVSGDKNGESSSILVFYLKSWFFKQKPWQPGDGRLLTIFDFSQITLSMIEFIFILVSLFVAKENMLIFAHEVMDNGFSSHVDAQQRSIERIVPAAGASENIKSSTLASTDINYRLSYHQLSRNTTRITQYSMFLCVFILALLPPQILLSIYSVTCTVACPLIATVLPGFFYYTITKDSQESTTATTQEEEKSSKCRLWLGFIYFLFNLCVMPVFLMLTMYTIQISTFQRKEAPDPQ